MKKIPFLALIMLFSMCKTVKTVFVPEKQLTIEEKIEEIKEEDRLPDAQDVVDLPEYAQVRDDFRSVSETSKTNYLKGMKATEDNYSVMILTQGFKGENVAVKNSHTTFYNGMTMSDLKTGITKSIRIENSEDIVLTDTFTKGTVTISADHAKMFKFIYVMKNNANKETPFKITYSNTLRPLR